MSDTPDPNEGNPATQVDPAAGDAGVGDEEVEFIQLDPRNLLEGIRKLQAENADFNKLFTNEVGNAAARQTRTKYEPELKTLKQQLEEERLQRRRLEVLGMEEREITKKFGEDPEFAREYAELVHHKPKPSAEEDPTEIIRAQFEEMLDEAKAAGLSDEFLGQIATKAANGGYSNDNAHWSVALRRVQRDIDNEVSKVKSTGPSVNPAITKPGADVSPAGRGNARGYPFKSLKEFKALPVADQNKYLDDDAAYKYVQELMKSGK